MSKSLSPKSLFLLAILTLLVVSGLAAWQMQARNQQMHGLADSTLPIQTLLRRIGEAAWHEDARKMSANANKESADNRLANGDIPESAPESVSQTPNSQQAGKGSNVESLYEELSAFGHSAVAEHLSWPGAQLELGKLIGSLQSVLDFSSAQQRYTRLQFAFSGLHQAGQSPSALALHSKTAMALTSANQRYAEAALSQQLRQSQQQLLSIAETANRHIEGQRSGSRTPLFIAAVVVILLALALLIQRRIGLAIVLIVVASVSLFLIDRQQQKNIQQASWIAQPLVTSTTEVNTAWMETQRLMQRFTELVLLHQTRAEQQAITSAYQSFSRLGNATQAHIIKAQELLEQPFLTETADPNEANGVRPKPNYPAEILELSKSMQRVSNSFTKMRGTANLVLAQQTSRRNAVRGRQLARDLANEHQGFLATIVELEHQAKQSIDAIQQRLSKHQYWVWGVMVLLVIVGLIAVVMPSRRSLPTT